jgi:hypothetical protein
MFIIYKDNSYGILCPILTVETDIEYEEVYLKHIFKNLKDSITKTYRLYKNNDRYFLTEEDNIVVGIKTPETWVVTQLFASADDTIKNYLKGL